MTRAPSERAISTVLSFEPESTTRTSSQNATLSRQARMFASSLTQMTTAESFGTGPARLLDQLGERVERRAQLARVREAPRLVAVHGAREARREAPRAVLRGDPVGGLDDAPADPVHGLAH